MSQDDHEAPLRNQVHFQDTFSAVIQGAKLPAKRRRTSIKPTVEALTSKCYETGILPDALAQLIDLLTIPSHLDQASLNSILRNLYPATSVDGNSVIKVVGCLGHGAQKPSLAIQAALLKWLIMIYHVIDNQNILSSTYSVLFNFLDTAAIRPQLCHLLALSTRRKHVRPHRIQTLLSLSRQTGNDPVLIGLLRVYKDYYPEIIVGEATRGKASAFKHPDAQWRERLNEIQRAHAVSYNEAKKHREAFRVFRQYTNGRKAPAIPQVHTSHAKENSITLEEIENVDSLVQGLETIELPNQLISVLGDPLLQKLMLLKHSPQSHQRISNWLLACAQDLISGEAGEEAEGILQILREYVLATKNVPPIVQSFFAEYLKVWDGQQSKHAILEILACTPLPLRGGFAGLYDAVFQPLEQKVLKGSAESQLNLLITYTALLRHWVTFLLSQDQNEDHMAVAASELITHVNKLCLSVVQISSTPSTHSAILDCYETSAYLASNAKLLRRIRIIFPPSPLVYILFFSSKPTTVSRLCGILARYKEGLQKVMASSSSSYSPAYINGFNGFLMDICNCLWRSRAFNARDANAHACLMPEGVLNDLTAYVKAVGTSSSLPMLFTLSESPAFVLLSASYMREIEDVEEEQATNGLEKRHAGPVTRSSLSSLAKNGGLNMSWDDYRLGVLSYLKDHGMSGVGDLMHNTMTTLIKKT